MRVPIAAFTDRARPAQQLLPRRSIGEAAVTASYGASAGVEARLSDLGTCGGHPLGLERAYVTAALVDAPYLRFGSQDDCEWRRRRRLLGRLRCIRCTRWLGQSSRVVFADDSRRDEEGCAEGPRGRESVLPP